MKPLVRNVFALVAAAFPIAQASAQQCVVLDDFNRADSTNLGPAWIEAEFDTRVFSNRFRNAVTEPAIAIYVPSSPAGVCVDVFAVNSSFISVVLNYLDHDNNAFVKIQETNANATFDRVYFYRGNNEANGPSFALATPVASARFRVKIEPPAVIATVDSNFDGVAEETFSTTALSLAGLGTMTGIGSFNGAMADNFGMLTDTIFKNGFDP